jgi:GNAT superfamily N-acetyltransferase
MNVLVDTLTMAATANSPSQRENPRIRAANGGDLAELARVINAAFIVERVAFDGDRIDRAKVRAYLDRGTFLLAEDESGALGCVFIELRGERSYLGLLSVYPARQGSGLGSKLVGAAEDFARAAGSRAMDLRVISPRAELVPFYRRLGYQETGTAPFPPDMATKIPAHYILLSKPLA